MSNSLKWVLAYGSSAAVTYQVNTTTLQPNNYIDIDLAALAKQQLFTDILLSAGLSIGEVNHQGDHLDLGLFNWYFLADSSKDEIQWLEQQLFTPSIANISKSPALKKQLWQLLDKQTQ